MVKLLAIFGSLAAFILLAIYIAASASRPPTYEETEAARTWSTLWLIGGGILVIGTPLLLLGAGGAALYRFLRRPRLVAPDQAGRVGLLVDDPQFADRAFASLAAYHATEQTRVTPVQPVPMHFSPTYTTTHNPTHNPTYSPTHERSELPPRAFDQPVLSLEDAFTPSLPDTARLADYLHEVKPHCLAFGIDTSGRLLQAPLSQSYHLLSSGRTRSGKSNSLNLILAQLHYQQKQHDLKASISVLDYKRELSAIWGRSSLVSLSTTDPNDMVDLLRGFVHGGDGLLARQDLFAREGERRGRVFGNLNDYERGTGETLERHFIAIDELNAVLLAADDKHLGDELAQLLYLGAGSGFFVVAGAHSLDANTFRRAAKEQFSTRLQHGAFSQSDVNLLFGSIKIDTADQKLLDGRAGRGLIQLVSQSHPTPFQGLHVEESDLLPFIDQRPALADQAVMQQLVAEADAVAAQTFGNDAPISEALRKNIWAKKQQGMSKEATIRALWNVGRSGKGIYPEMARLYDRVIGLGEPETATEQAHA